MNKVVINNCYGGFGLSVTAKKRYEELSGKVLSWDLSEIPRHDPALVQTVEELGKDANGINACLLVKEIPGNKYLIDEYDGAEDVLFPEMNWIVIED